MANLPKIALIGTLPPTIGGISTHTKNLKKRLEQNNYDVAVIDTISKNNQSNILSGRNPLSFFWSLFSLSCKGYNIFHFHSSKRAYPFLISILFLKLFRKKVILSIHHGGFNDWLSQSRFKERLYIFFFLLADKIIFMNAGDAVGFRKLASADKNKIKSASPFIVEDEKYYHKKYPIVKHDEKFLVTTMGGWRVFYLTENVIEACINIIEEWAVSIELDIIAMTSEMNEDYKQKILKMVKDESREDFHISVTENKDGILSYLVGRDVLVRSSRTDSYGMCVAEALMLGTPAIATNVCPRPSNALLYESNDVDELTSLLKKTLKESRNRTKKESMITKDDDSYFSIEEIYSSLET